MGFEWQGDFKVFDKLKKQIEERVLNAIGKTGETITSLAKNNLTKEHGVATNTLKNNITWTTRARGEFVVAEFQGKNISRLPPPPGGVKEGEFALTVGTALAYGGFLEGGTAPHFPPIEAIKNWVHQKGLSADIAITGTYSVKTHRRTGNKSEQESQDESVAFLIARSISKKGTRPFPWLYPATQEGIRNFDAILTNELKGMPLK